MIRRVEEMNKTLIPLLLLMGLQGKAPEPER